MLVCVEVDVLKDVEEVPSVEAVVVVPDEDVLDVLTTVEDTEGDEVVVDLPVVVDLEADVEDVED